MRNSATVVVVVFSFVLFSAITPTSADSCADVLLLWARGSGQTLLKDNPDEPEKEIDSFYTEFEDRFALTPDITIENRELLYPAKPNLDDDGPWGFVGAEFKIREDGFNTYDISRRDGTDLAVQEITQAISECPDQRVVLGGYSQGAHVMGNALHRLPDNVADNISFVGLFGDPRFNPRSLAAKGTFRTGKLETTIRTPDKKITFNQVGGVLERRPEFPAIVTEKGRIESWCVLYDGICENDYSRLNGGRSKHGTYSDWAIPSAMTSAAVKVMRDLNTINPDRPITLEFGSENSANPMDIVFVIEYNSATRTLKNGKHVNAQRWIDELSKHYSDLRLGITHYYDIGGCACSETDSRLNDGHHFAQEKLRLTDDFNEFKKRLDTWSVSGKSASIAGSGTRGMYTGMVHALRHQPWREGAQKKIIVIAASPPADPEKISRLAVPGGGNDVDVQLTAQHVITKAHNVDPVNVYGVGLNPDKDFSAIESLANATEGKFYTYHDGLELVSNLVSELNQRPVAVTPLYYDGFVGIPITLSAASSYDPDGDQIIKYRWDFDDDGIIDQTTSNPVATHTYTAPYEGFASVQVVSEDESTNTATPTMNIVEGTPEPIPKPKNFQSQTTSDQTTKLSWSYDADESTYYRLFIDSEYFGSIPGIAKDYTINIDNTKAHSFALIAVADTGISEAAVATTQAFAEESLPFASTTDITPKNTILDPSINDSEQQTGELDLYDSTSLFANDNNTSGTNQNEILGESTNSDYSFWLWTGFISTVIGIPTIILISNKT